jgi:hypothetical protein
MNDEALKAAYLAGFNASGEGYNGEYPFGDHVQDPEEDAVWCKDRDNELATIKQALAAPTVQEPVGKCKDATMQSLKDLWRSVCDEVGKKAFAQPAPVQEPVAWIEHHKGGDNLEWDNPGGKCTALYITPPAAQRQWVGLTPTERKQIEKRYVFVEDAIRLTEAKLKENNT